MIDPEKMGAHCCNQGIFFSRYEAYPHFHYKNGNAINNESSWPEQSRGASLVSTNFIGLGSDRLEQRCMDVIRTNLFTYRDRIMSDRSTNIYNASWSDQCHMHAARLSIHQFSKIARV